MLFLSLAVISSKAANAAESIPPLQWGQYQVPVSNFMYKITSSPTSSVTLGCNDTNLSSYNQYGTSILTVDRTQSLDGVKNCMTTPVVDNNGDVYGTYYGKIDGSSGMAYGPNLLAYKGNSLKWKYPVSCGSQGSKVTVGADGNIYVTTYVAGQNGLHLIGLSPNLKTGESVPAKIFDVVIPSDCSTELFAYKSGIVLRGQSSNAGIYTYTYSGRNLGRPESNGDFWSMKVNDEGRIFTANLSGNLTSIKAYDAPQGVPSWTYNLVQGSSINTLHPTLGGGVVALIQEPNMVAPGIPTSPPSSSLKLIRVNNNGTKTAPDIVLETTNTQGKIYEQTYVEVTTNNKIVVVRGYYRPTGLSWPTTTPAVSIAVVNALSGVKEYDKILAGDGPSGYLLDSAPVVTKDAIHFIALCQNGCLKTGRYLYAVSVPGVGLDYPRGSVLAAVTSQSIVKKKYVALGDSFSSGEGAPAFDYRTDIDGTNECHRSVYSYPELLAKDPDLNLGLTNFVACSGAVVDNLQINKSGQHNEPTQFNSLSSDTKIVTLTIGGNNVGFAGYMFTCQHMCGPGTSAYDTTMNNINDPAFKTKLVTTYAGILSKATQAKVYVGDYPYMSSDATKDCWITDLSGMRNLQVALNNVIKTAISDMKAALISGSDRLYYVPSNYTGSPFTNKHLCNGAGPSFFNDKDLANSEYSYHPNKAGAAAYATVFKNYILSH
jgi:hypothetical protein